MTERLEELVGPRIGGEHDGARGERPAILDGDLQLASVIGDPRDPRALEQGRPGPARQPLVGIVAHFGVGEAGIRLQKSGEAGDVWVPLDTIAEAKLVLTDALIKAAPRGGESHGTNA